MEPMLSIWSSKEKEVEKGVKAPHLARGACANMSKWEVSGLSGRGKEISKAKK